MFNLHSVSKSYILKFKFYKLLKLLNIYAYDKETLNNINPDYENYQKNFVKFNDKSFIFSRGYLELTRKIKKLDIYFRYSPNNKLWNASKNTERIIKNISKKTLICVRDRRPRVL